LRVTRGGHYRNAQPGSRGPIGRGRELDRVDRALIEALQRNGRDSFRRIAAALGVSEATVRARYRRLCRDEILQVTAITNPLGLGFGAMAMVGVRTSGPPRRVADAIAAWDEAGYIVVTAGSFDVLVELVCTDPSHLLEMTNQMRELEGVLSTETFLYLELRKELYDWGVRTDDLPDRSGQAA
jgi:Lrp/AsnC family transcriptional regulator, regulator for asnA, asnC and gidA